MPIFQNGIRTAPSTAELPDDAELWRYMSLSAFLMLLRGKVYIPTIEELREEDPTEGTGRCERTRFHFANLSGPDLEWLQAHAKEQEMSILKHPQTGSQQRAKIFMSIWDRELAKRRTIWCWHRAAIESMALWHVYGKEGVAIKTTPAKLKKAVHPAHFDNAIIASVHYVQDAHLEALGHHFMRPYLLKQKCYAHENEVRVVFPRNSDDPNGRRLLSINAQKLISEVWISPHIHRSEAVEIRETLIHAWAAGKKCNSNGNAPAILVSDAKTVFESTLKHLEQNQCEPYGCAQFGPNIPFVLRGDLTQDLH